MPSWSSPWNMCTSPKLPGTGFLIVGSSGFIGRQLAQSLQGSIGVGRAELDLRGPDLDAVQRGGVDLSGVRIGIIAAAVSRIGACESDPIGTRQVNVLGTLELARQFASRGIKTVWFSSDYVFDGRQGKYIDDATLSPANHYGSQKAEVERELAKVTGGNCLILRIGKTYGLTPGDGTLLDEMFGLLTRGKPVRAATDQVLNPTCVYDLVRAVRELAETRCGKLNCCSPEIVTRYDLALAAAAALGADRALVQAISLDDLGDAFVRPKNNGMLVSEAVRAFGFVPVRDALEYLAEAYRETGCRA